jgi:hypothetical protein
MRMFLTLGIPAMGTPLLLAVGLLCSTFILTAALNDEAGNVQRIVRLRKGAVTTGRAQSQWRAENRQVTLNIAAYNQPNRRPCLILHIQRPRRERWWPGCRGALVDWHATGSSGLSG